MDTYKIILEAHSGIAYVALFTIGVATINSLIGLSAKNEFKPKDRRIALCSSPICFWTDTVFCFSKRNCPVWTGRYERNYGK